MTVSIDKKKHKTKKSSNKKVKIQLDNGQIKDPKEQLSNERKREHQHTRENIKRVTDEDHNKYIEIQNEKCLQKFIPCLALLISICIFGIILYYYL